MWKQLEKGNDVFLEIEVQGALQVKEFPWEGVFYLFYFTSLEELKNRIIGRGTESDELVRNRLKEAEKEIRMMSEYDYVVVNDDVDQAVQKVKKQLLWANIAKERELRQEI